MTAPRLLFAAALLAAALPLSAAPAGNGAELTGAVDALLSGSAGAGEAADFSWGFEEYANLRLKIRVGERAAFHAAANLISAAGAPAAAAAAAESAGLGESALLAGTGYAAALELERLYFRVAGDNFDADAGLMRLAFGYGQAWSPSDFLGPRNPLLPDARPRGALGVAASAYPAEPLKLKAFAVAPRDPESADGEGVRVGASADLHLDRASLQALYAWESDAPGAGTHRAGGSLKLEAEVGVALDALCVFGPGVRGTEGLAAAAGIDYSFLGGDLYALVQYLYSGGGNPTFAYLRRTHYLYGTATYRFDDYTSATLDCAASLEDGSASPSLTVSHEPFQGLTASLSLRVPLGGSDGEFGPETSGSRASVTAKTRLKF